MAAAPVLPTLFLCRRTDAGGVRPCTEQATRATSHILQRPSAVAWAGSGRDRGTRGGVIGVVAPVRERRLWPEEAAMFGPLAVRRGAGRARRVCVSDPGGGVSRIREKHPSGRGEAVRETLRKRQYLHVYVSKLKYYVVPIPVSLNLMKQGIVPFQTDNNTPRQFSLNT